MSIVNTINTLLQSDPYLPTIVTNWGGEIGTGQCVSKTGKRTKYFPIQRCPKPTIDCSSNEMGKDSKFSRFVLLGKDERMISLLRPVSSRDITTNRKFCKFEQKVMAIFVLNRSFFKVAEDCCVVTPQLINYILTNLPNKITKQSCGGLYNDFRIKGKRPVTDLNEIFKGYTPECFAHYGNPSCGFEVFAIELTVQYVACDEVPDIETIEPPKPC